MARPDDPDPPGGREAAGTDEAGREAAGTDEAGREAAGTDEAGREAAGTDEAGREAAGTDEAGREAAGPRHAGREAAGSADAGRDDAGPYHPAPSALLVVELAQPHAASPAGPLARREREQAIRDLRLAARFTVRGVPGPFRLRLSLEQGRLVLDVRDPDDAPHHLFGLSLGPFRRLIKDYVMILDSYEEASRHGVPAARLRTVDMARRSVHDEAATVLAGRLRGRIDVDHDTARRLFTLLAVLSGRQ